MTCDGVFAPRALSRERLRPYLDDPSGCLDVAAVAEAVLGDQPLRPAERRRRIVAKLRTMPGWVPRDADTWVFLPVVRTGAHLVQPLSSTGDVAWIPEVRTLWQPDFPRPRPVRITLPDGRVTRFTWTGPLDRPRVSATFRRALQAMRASGATALAIWCEDGPSNRFRVAPTALDACDRTASTARLTAQILAIMARRRRSVSLEEVAADCLARGIYGAACAPWPIAYALGSLRDRIRIEWGNLRPMPRALRQGLQTLLGQWDWNDYMVSGGYARDSGGLPPPPGPARDRGPHPVAYRLRIQRVGRPREVYLECPADASWADLYRAVRKRVDGAGAPEPDGWMIVLAEPPEAPLLAFGPEGGPDVLGLTECAPLRDSGLEAGQAFTVLRPAYEHPTRYRVTVEAVQQAN